MSIIYDQILTRKSYHEQPPYLLERPVGETFWEAKRAANRAILNSDKENRGELDLSSVAARRLATAKRYQSQPPAGHSKYLKNLEQSYRVPLHSEVHLGPQWDAEATRGLRDVRRFINHYRGGYTSHVNLGGSGPAGSTIVDNSIEPGSPAIGSPGPARGAALTALRRGENYRAGMFRADIKEGKKTISGPAATVIAARKVLTNETPSELPHYPRHGAGMDPGTENTPASGWVPPTVETRYEKMSPELRESSARKLDLTIPKMSVLQIQ